MELFDNLFPGLRDQVNSLVLNVISPDVLGDDLGLLLIVIVVLHVLLRLLFLHSGYPVVIIGKLGSPLRQLGIRVFNLVDVVHNDDCLRLLLLSLLYSTQDHLTNIHVLILESYRLLCTIVILAHYFRVLPIEIHLDSLS